MGGNQSKSMKNSQVYVKTDSQEYFAGDKVIGKIALILDTDLKDARLFLTMIGKENVRFKSNTAQFFNSSSEIRGSNVLISKRIPVPLRVNETLKTGQYIFPFSLDLPSNLPGSFNTATGNITYTIGAALENKGKEILDYKGEFSVRQMVKDMKFDLEYSQAKTIKTFLFAEQGLCKLSFKLDKNAVSTGDSVVGKLFLDASGLLLTVRQVKVTLRQELEYHYKGSKGSYNRGIAMQVYEGVMPGGVMEYPVLMQVPNGELPTITGSIVRCRYVLKLKAKVGGMRIFSRSPCLLVPISIFAKPAIVQDVQPPPNWNPIEMPNYAISVETGISLAIPIQELAIGEIQQIPSNYPQHQPTQNFNYNANPHPNANNQYSQYPQYQEQAKSQPQASDYFRNFK